MERKLLILMTILNTGIGNYFEDVPWQEYYEMDCCPNPPPPPPPLPPDLQHMLAFLLFS